MHVAAMNPAFVTAEDVPADCVAKEKEIALGQMTDKDKAKPADILEKIIAGKVNKIIAEMTLTGQPYVLDTNVTVGEALKKEGAEVISVASPGCRRRHREAAGRFRCGSDEAGWPGVSLHPLRPTKKPRLSRLFCGSASQRTPTGRRNRYNPHAFCPTQSGDPP